MGTTKMTKEEFENANITFEKPDREWVKEISRTNKIIKLVQVNTEFDCKYDSPEDAETVYLVKDTVENREKIAEIKKLIDEGNETGDYDCGSLISDIIFSMEKVDSTLEVIYW